ncbi:protein MMS22-like isoform X4 [Ruditapes philippinarum]|uniref:protein MMS22-like isoform X3 n=1 Tax=Ruditapes philippinarum TaxID=129788 RepID=UPI00295AE6FB|nr:protein MMS22-like isoform X3 [Ruditapes philippinarum]XP_060567452.1 protein MMS22-like isoform X4 [Ruditapes philippinarum]
MMSGDSLTPPLSPESTGFHIPDLLDPSPPKLSRPEETKDVCFRCIGEFLYKETLFHGDSYWRSGYLHWLLSCNTSHFVPETESLSLFEHTWPSSIMKNMNIDKLFLILKQQIGELQSLVQRSTVSFVIEETVNGQDIREQMCRFLQFIMISIQSNSVGDVDKLVVSLHSLLLYIGRLSDLPSHVLQSTFEGRKSNILYQYVHLHFDVYWRVLSIVHVLQIKFPDYKYRRRFCVTPDNDLNTSLYDQVLHVILWEFVTLGNFRQASKVDNEDPIKTSIFSCSCVKELWALVLRLTEWRSSSHLGESFWMSLHHVIKSVIDNEDVEMMTDCEDTSVLLNPPDGFKTDDKVGLCLWIMYCVSPLFGVQVTGSSVSDYSLVSNYHDLQSLLKKLLSTNGLTESTLRQHLKTCLLLTSHWEPDISILITLWDFFYKRLNQSDLSTGTGSLKSLELVDQSVCSMYERCKDWTRGHLGSLDKETSFQLFLRLLSQHVGELYRKGFTQEWKQVKGRIYSKFHARRIQDLMEGGLYNLSTLFITLGMTADLEDVASKLCDFYDMLDINSITFARRSVVWRGAFTLMLVYVDKQIDIGFLADRLVAAFTNVVSNFGGAGIDIKHSLWKMILIYLEGLQEIVENSETLQLSEYKLICPAIHKLLSVSSEHELRTTLATLHIVVDKFRQVRQQATVDVLPTVRCSLQHAEFGSALWQNVYSFILEHASTLTPPPILADIAASFCLLSLTSPSDDKSITFLDVFQTFAASDKVNVSISCRFLSHLLSCNKVLDKLRSDVDNYERLIVSVWFKCCLYVPAGSQMLAEITRPVMQLKSVQDILRQAEMDIIGDIDQAPVLFLKALETAHMKTQDWQEKMAFQKQIIPYFTDVQKSIAPILRTMSPAEVVNNIYRMTGYLIKYCAKLLYVQQDVIVPSLISSLIVPHSVLNPDVPLNNVFLNVIRDHLHLFIQGLRKLPYEKDPYVQRRFRDIVMLYLPKFSLSSSSSSASVTAAHPLVVSLSETFIQSPPQDSVKFRHYIILIVVNNLLPVKNMTVHPNHILGFSFIKEIVQRTASSEVKARELPMMLPVCLEYMLLLPNTSSTWNLVLAILQHLTEAFYCQKQCVQLCELTVVMEQFISSYFKFSSTGVLKLMEKMALLLQDAVVTVIPKLSESVRNIEKLRGFGTDQKLRGQYCQVLKQLGETGVQEIQKLKTSDT